MTAGTLFRMYQTGKVDFSRYTLAINSGIFSVFNSVLGAMANLFCHRRASAVKIASPIFVIGHWRSGTTLLHELLSLDPGFTYPSTYSTGAPSHFLLTSRFLKPIIERTLPGTRVMDGMKVGMDLPQEDEFALMLMGAASPYLCLAFPRQALQILELMDVTRLAPSELQYWRNAATRFYQRVLAERPGQLVLKSPGHTARMGVLNKMFPDARFVHIVRDPEEVFSSTLRTWTQLVEAHRLQRNDFPGREFVLRGYELMYECYFRDQPGVDPDRLITIRFDELESDPVRVINGIYTKFGFEKPADLGAEIVERMSRPYTKNRRARISPEDREAIEQRWGPYYRRLELK